MEVPSYFIDFLKEIRPTEKERAALRDAHIELRDRLMAYEPLKRALVTTFLQGSYRRTTALTPAPKRRSDVDIIVVTRLHENEYTPSQAMEQFRPFVTEHYKGKYRYQGRSIGITLGDVDLDLVITSAPVEMVMGVLSEAENDPMDDSKLLEVIKKTANAEWKEHPLRIPDRKAETWESTHPLAQIDWTREKNASTNGHFVNVVKAIKWWKYWQWPNIDQPSGYPLERIVGECCPDEITSVAEGVTKTMEGFVRRFAGGKPVLADRGCHPDVLARLSREDFHTFYGLVASAAKTARRALDAEKLADSVNLWRDLFGPKFPEPPREDGGIKGGFTPRQNPSNPGSGRFA